MVNFLQALGNAGFAAQSANDQNAALLKRKQDAAYAQLQQQELQQRINAQQIEAKQRQDQISQQPGVDQATWAAIRATGGGQNSPTLPGVPQAAPGGIPGGQQIPPGVNLGAGAPPVIPRMATNAPGGQMMGNFQMPQGTPQGLNIPQMAQKPPLAQQPQGARPGGANPPGGGGMSFATAIQYIDSQPGLTDAQKRSALSNMLPLINDEEKLRNQEILLDLKKTVADKELENATLKLQNANGGNAVDKTAARELDAQVLKLGGNPRKMSEDQRYAFVAEKNENKPVKLNAGQQRVKDESTKVEGLVNEIRALIKESPDAVGAYGELNLGVTKAAHLLPDAVADVLPGVSGVAPKNAGAAERLKVKLTQLTQALGVVGAAGGQGTAASTKQWISALGDKDIFQSPELLDAALDSIRGGVSGLVSEGGGSSGGEGVDPLVNKYLGSK